MNINDLIPDNIGRDVRIESLNGFNDARATLRSWSSDKTVAILKLSSTYGRVPKMVRCSYCDGNGEVAESSTRYMSCPSCGGKGQRNSGRGKLLSNGTLLEIPIANVRFAPGEKQ